MSDFQPPPTWALPILVNEQTKQAQFNPIWLKWFVDLAGVLNSFGGGSGTADHNMLSGLQGGAADEYYHLDASAYAQLVNKPFPVGSIFISVVSTNPSSLLGYGTWVAFATGRTLVGLDSGDADFNPVEHTGGAKSVTLTTVSVQTAGVGPVDAAAPQTVDTLPPYIVVYMWKRTA